MTDIRIRKRRRPVWPWILGLILLIGLGWLVIDTFVDREEVESPTVREDMETPYEDEGDEFYEDDRDYEQPMDEDLKAPDVMNYFR